MVDMLLRAANCRRLLSIHITTTKLHYSPASSDTLVVESHSLQIELIMYKNGTKVL